MGRVGNPVCGDLMEIYIKVKENRLEDIKIKTFGCGSAIATASMVTELAKGKTLEEAEKVTRQDVANELDGLPPAKMHCSNLAADALRDAIKKYREKEGGSAKTAQETKATLREIPGEKEFLDKGVYHLVEDFSEFKDKRVLIAEGSERTVETALELTKLTPRVVFVTALKESSVDAGLKNRFIESGVKVLYESDILEIKGFNEVEKVVIHNLDEDEEYELFVDSVIMEKPDNMAAEPASPEQLMEQVNGV
jgi:nitrogen fixation NifU-like protein